MFSNTKALAIPEGNVVKITAGSQVLWEKVTGRIPSAYQEVEWIQAGANVGAYIDLGFSYDTGATIYMGQYIANDNTAYPFGAAENSGKLRCMLSSPYSSASVLYCSQASGFQSISDAYVKNVTNHFVATYKDNSCVFKNLTSSVSHSVSNMISYTMSNNLYLFAQNYNGTPRFGDIRRISYFKYYDKTDTLICNLVPCYRKSDNTIGMYDTTRNIFLTNIGSGVFTHGQSINYTNLVPLSTEADGVTIYNNELGYKDEYRIRSGGDDSISTGCSCTGFIPFVKGDKLYIYPAFTGQNTSNAINFADKTFTNLGQVTDSGSGYGICAVNGIAVGKTEVVNGVSVLDISNITAPGFENIAFVRITNDSSQAIGAEMIITKNEEIEL